MLRLAKFRTHAEHGCPARKNECGQKVALVLLPRRLYRWIRGVALHAMVPGAVLVGAVAVVLAIGLIMFVVIRDKVSQGEAVMRGDEINRARRALMPEPIGGAAQPRGKIRQCAVPTPKIAHGIAVLIVPFAPCGGKGPKLIAARPDVPRLGDEFQPTQHRVLLNRGHQRRGGVKAGAAAKGRCQIKAKAMHAAIFGPCAQAVHHKAHQMRALQCQAVAAAHIIDIKTFIVLQTIISGIVQPAETHRRAQFVALTAVIIDHVYQRFKAVFC